MASETLNRAACGSEVIHLGKKAICNNSALYGNPKWFYFLREGFIMDTGGFLTKATWDAAVRAGNILPLEIDSLEWPNQEATFYTFPSGKVVKVSDQVYIADIGLNASSCYKKEVLKLEGFKGSVVIGYATGYLQGALSTSEEVRGNYIDYISVSGETQKALGSDDPKILKLKIVFDAFKDFNHFEHVREITDWSLSDLDGLTVPSIDIVGTPSATSIVFNATVLCGNTYVPIRGIAKENLSLLKASDGTAQTITTLTEGENGQYTIAGSGLVTGTLDFKAPTDADAYPAFPLTKCATAATVTIA